MPASGCAAGVPAGEASGAPVATGRPEPGRSWSRPSTVPVSKTAEAPSRPHRDRPVALDGGRARVEVDDERGVFVDAEDPDPIGQVGLEGRQSALTEVTEAGVVATALGVVVVGDEGHVQADLGEQVEALGPERLGAHLVDLVDGHGGDAEGEGGGGRERHGAPGAELLGQELREGRTLPLAQRVGGAARPGEDVGRIGDGGQRPFPRDGVVVGVSPRGHLDGMAHRGPEVLLGLGRDVVGVLLEAVRRVEQDGVTRPGGPHRLHHPPVGLDHRRGGLARSHDRQQSGHRGSPAQRSRFSQPGYGGDRPPGRGVGRGDRGRRRSTRPARRPVATQPVATRPAATRPPVPRCRPRHG